MNDISEYNSNGWATIHEAAYNGSEEDLNAILEHARELHRNVIDMRTADDMKTTPLLIAALGGHMDIIKLLLDNGADINAQLTFRNIIQHGLVEVAVIRQDFDLLSFLYDKFPDFCNRLRNLMASEKLDNESRVAVGRTIEVLSQEYPSIILKFKNSSDQVKEVLSVQHMITYNTINHNDFGYCLNEFFQLGSEAEEVTVSTVMILLNVISEENFRKKFIQSKGIKNLMEFMKQQKSKLTKKIEAYEKKFKVSHKIVKVLEESTKKKRFFSAQDGSELKTENDYSTDEKIIEDEPIDDDIIEQETYIQCACIGHALGAFCKYSDCIDYINQESFGDSIIDYIKTMFEWNKLCKKFSIFETVNIVKNNASLNNPEGSMENFDSEIEEDHSPILFEQYISSYITCLGILTHESYYNKQLFLKAYLYERLMDFWKQLGNLSESNKNLNMKNLANQENESENDETTSSHSNDDKETVVDMKITSINRVLDKLTTVLMKQLKIATIECLGKALYHFDLLKEKYILSNQNSDFKANLKPEHKDWPKMADEFIKKLITYLDSSVCLDRELQLAVLKFFKLICQDDYKMQLKLVDQNNAFNSSLINSIRMLLRKSSLESIRTTAMYLLWSITGAQNNEDFHDRKCCIYRAIGSQRFIDTLFDGDDEINLICLEALSSILKSPPHRDTETNQLVKIQEEVAKLHAIPAILRLLKSPNERLLIASLKSIEAACVWIGYSINSKNQSIVKNQAGIAAILDITKSKTSSTRLKTEAYYTLSMVCLNNPANKKILFESIEYRVDLLIYEIRNIWLNQKVKVCDNQSVELEDLTMQLRAGLALCGFCFKTEDFTRKVLTTFGRVQWDHFRKMLHRLNSLLEKVTANEDKKMIFQVQNLRCMFGFQIASLTNLISYSNEDPRAIGLKVMIDIIPKADNSYLRSIVCDYIGRVIILDDCLLDCFIAINAVETITKSTFDTTDSESGKKLLRGDAEKGCASVTLGVFTNLHPEARRRLLRLSRKNFKIMDALKYSNELLNIDLKRDWKHFKELSDVVLNYKPTSHSKEIKFAKFEKLPPIASDENTKKNIALLTN